MGTPKIKDRVWTPWGIADSVMEIIPGVSLVSTPGHGGLMIEGNQILSDYAKEVGTLRDGVYFFEEDVLMNIPIIELDLPNFNKERAINILAYDHDQYLKLMGLQDKVTADARKAALTHQLNLKRRAEKDPDLITSALRLDKGTNFTAWTASGDAYILEGPKKSNTASEHEIICCISSLIDQLGKKSTYPILTESMGLELEEDFLEYVKCDSGGTLMVIDADSESLKVNLTLATKNEKKHIKLDQNDHEIIHRLVLAFAR